MVVVVVVIYNYKNSGLIKHATEYIADNCFANMIRYGDINVRSNA